MSARCCCTSSDFFTVSTWLSNFAAVLSSTRISASILSLVLETSPRQPALQGSHRSRLAMPPAPVQRPVQDQRFRSRRCLGCQCLASFSALHVHSASPQESSEESHVTWSCSAVCATPLSVAFEMLSTHWSRFRRTRHLPSRSRPFRRCLSKLVNMLFTVIMTRFWAPVLSARFMTPMTPIPALIWSLSWTSSCPSPRPVRVLVPDPCPGPRPDFDCDHS